MIIKKCTTVAGEIVPKSHFCDYLLQTGQKLTIFPMSFNQRHSTRK